MTREDSGGVSGGLEQAKMISLLPGTRVAVSGLKGAKVKSMNGVEGIVKKYKKDKDRYIVDFPDGPMKVQRLNLTVLPTTEQQQQQPQVFGNMDEMMEGLKGMGMPPEMLNALTLEQKKAMMLMTMKSEVVEKAKNTPGVMADSKELTEERDGVYGWKDAKDHVYLEVKNATPLTTCVLGENTLQVMTSAGGEAMLEGELFQDIDLTKSGYELRGEKLLITLVKKQPMRWLMVLR